MIIDSIKYIINLTSDQNIKKYVHVDEFATGLYTVSTNNWSVIVYVYSIAGANVLYLSMELDW